MTVGPQPGPWPDTRLDTTTVELNSAAGAVTHAATFAGAAQVPLNLLAAELRSGGQRAAGVDLLAAYSPSDLLPDVPVPRRRLVVVLAAVRDISVFAPIAITWWGLRGALMAWRESGSRESLIQFWQSAEGVIPISDSALWIVLSLIVVAMLTMLIARLDGFAASSGDRSAAREMLAAGLARATLALASRANTDIVSAKGLNHVAGQIQASSGELTSIMRKVSTDLGTVLQVGPANELNKALKRWNESAAALTELGKGLRKPTQIIEEWTALRKQIELEQQQLQVGIKQLVHKLEKAADHSAEESKAYNVVVQQVRETTSQLAQAMSVFSRSGESLQQLTVQMQGLLREITLTNEYGGVSAGSGGSGYRNERGDNP